MIASLGMYDFPWLHAANDALWRAVAARLDHAPATLTRSRPLPAIWAAPDLLLAQTCGYPLTHGLDVALVATPVYDAPGCNAGWHRSALVVRADDPAQTLADLAGRRAAINAPDSNTGMNLLRAAFAPLARSGRFFGAVITTGAHRRSLAAVVGGHADVAAIDAVSWALIGDRYPHLGRRARLIGWTEATPGLPLVSAATRTPADRDRLRAAFGAALADPALAPHRARLRLTGITTIARSAYDRITAIEAQARALGYLEVA